MLQRPLQALLTAFLWAWLLAAGQSAHAADCTASQLPYRAQGAGSLSPTWGVTAENACLLFGQAADIESGPGLSGSYLGTSTPATYGGSSVCHVVGYGNSWAVTLTNTGCTMASTGGGTTVTNTVTVPEWSMACTGDCNITLSVSQNTATQTVTVDVPPFNLTLEEGGQIAIAIVAVWVVGWAFRAFRKTLDTDGTSSTSRESES